MAENILAAACESETRKAAKRMRLEIYQTSQVRCLWPEVGVGKIREVSEKFGKAFLKPFLKVRGLQNRATWCVLRFRPAGLGTLFCAGCAAAAGDQMSPRCPSHQPQRTAGLLAGVSLCFPCAGRTDRSRQAALQRLHSHHPLFLFTASFILLPRPGLHQWKPELQLPWLRVPGGQPAATRLPPDGQPQ